MNCVKFKLEKDFEIRNFKYYVKDYGLEVTESGSVDYLGANYTVCGEDPQYCPPGKRKYFLRA